VNNIESWGFDFPQSTYIQKFAGLPSNNQDLSYIHYYLFIICVGCAMLVSFKLSN